MAVVKKPVNNLLVFGFCLVMIVIASRFICGGACGSSNESDKGMRTTDDKYILSFSENFKKGLASVDDLGLSIVIAVDCSGSMSEAPAAGGGSPKYIQASESLTGIVNFLENFYATKAAKEKLTLKVGLLRFNDDVKELYPLTQMSPAEFLKLKSITGDVSNFNPDGYTAIGETMASGTEILMQSGTIFKSLIIISDGENTSGVKPEDVLDAVVNSRNTATSPELPVLTNGVLVSFVGFDIGKEKFQELHKIGARVTSAGNKNELMTSLKDIFLADITRLEAR